MSTRFYLARCRPNDSRPGPCEVAAWTGETEVQNRDERNLRLQFMRRQYVGCVVRDDFEVCCLGPRLGYGI
jgi:hypothetical protein